MRKVALLALLSVAACRPPHMQPFALDGKVTVELPNKPYPLNTHIFSKLKHPERMKMWTLKTLGGTYHLIRTVNPAMRVAACDTLEREACYDRMAEALKERKAQLIVQRSCRIAGIKGRDFAYRSHATANSVLVYSRNFVVDSVGYTLDFVPSLPEQKGLLGTINAAQRRRFFDSITVKP